MNGKKLDPEIKQLILWRIETGVPSHFKLVIGDRGSFSKEELKHHVEQEDDIGLKVVEVELSFIRALSSGEFSKFLAETHE